jgi:hypothetical protein
MVKLYDNPVFNFFRKCKLFCLFEIGSYYVAQAGLIWSYALGSGMQGLQEYATMLGTNDFQCSFEPCEFYTHL